MERSTAAVRLLAGDKEPVRLASTANLTLAGLLTVDGIVTVAGNRVLVKNQTDATANGIYTASEGAWYRAPDSNSRRTMIAGMKVHVQEGQAHAGDVWSLLTNKPNFGTDAIAFELFINTSIIDDINAARETMVAQMDAIIEAGLNAGKATQAEAEAGTSNAGWMTPLRTRQAIDAGSFQRTRAAAASVTIPSATEIVVIGGVAVAGDTERLEPYVTVGVTEPAHEGKFQNGVNWFAINSHIIRPESFAAFTGVDDTNALLYCAEYLQGRGGGGVEFKPGRTYPINRGGGFPVLGFQGLKNVTIAGNGATIEHANTNQSPMVIYLDDTDDVVVENLNMVALYPVFAGTNGPVWISAINGSRKISMRNLSMTGGAVGFQALGKQAGSASDTDRVGEIEAINVNTDRTYYGFNFQGAGDYFFGRNLRTINTGRCYFPWNVKQHDVQIASSHGGPFSDVLLKVYGSTVFYTALENIKLDYLTLARHPGSGNQNSQEAMVAMDAQLDTSNGGPVIMRDIEIKVRGDASGGSQKFQSVFCIRKYDAAGLPDNTARGHLLENIRLSGVMASCQNLLSAGAHLFDRDNWSGEYISGVSLERLLLDGVSPANNAVLIDGRGLTELGMMVRQCASPGLITATNATSPKLKQEWSHFANSDTRT